MLIDWQRRECHTDEQASWWWMKLSVDEPGHRLVTACSGTRQPDVVSCVFEKHVGLSFSLFCYKLTLPEVMEVGTKSDFPSCGHSYLAPKQTLQDRFVFLALIRCRHRLQRMGPNSNGLKLPKLS